MNEENNNFIENDMQKINETVAKMFANAGVTTYTLAEEDGPEELKEFSDDGYFAPSSKSGKKGATVNGL